MQWILGAVMAALVLVTGTAAAEGWELDNPTERRTDLMYGLEKVCLPAQRTGQEVGDYEKDNRNSLTLARRQNPNSKRTPMWGVNSRSNVVVMESEGGCNVSTSFRQDQSDRLIPEMRTYLSEKAVASEVVSGSLDNYDERLAVAYCVPNDSGSVDSFLLYEWVQNETAETGRRANRDILYVSLVAPTAGFCPQA